MTKTHRPENRSGQEEKRPNLESRSQEIGNYIIGSLQLQPEYNYFVLSFPGCSHPKHFEDMLLRELNQAFREADTSGESASQAMQNFLKQLLYQKGLDTESLQFVLKHADHQSMQALAYESLETNGLVDAYPKSHLEKSRSPLYHGDRMSHLFFVLLVTIGSSTKLLNTPKSSRKDVTEPQNYNQTLAARWNRLRTDRELSPELALEVTTQIVEQDLAFAKDWIKKQKAIAAVEANQLDRSVR